jgi:hypothetical protein
VKLSERFDSGLRIRRTDAPAAKEGGLWYTEDGQSTFTDGTGNKFWFIDTTGGSVTVNLPDADKVTADTIYTVKRKTAGANTLTVQAAVGNIDGAATHSIPTQYAAYSYISDGENYWIV